LFLQERVRTVTAETFETVALEVFRFQAASNPVYARYLQLLNIRPAAVQRLTQVPFLPIDFFKKHSVVTGTPRIEAVFESSGTTGSQNSRHLVADLNWYNTISTRIFEQQYGPLNQFHILALLPSYLERNNSSLVYMVQQFIKKNDSSISGFFLNTADALHAQLLHLAQQPDGRKVLLWGVTFALMDWAESGQDLSFLRQIPDLIVMETGGMKGRRRELIRQEVHAQLTEAFGVRGVHSEYGMTELLSQSYSVGEGVFAPSATMRILLRDTNDPFALYDHTAPPRYGGINVIDLANIDSCAFVETQDLGRFVANSAHFEVIGRFDNSDVRGCNLLI
jgi:Acyl-protein synthetase, LuxE